ncbi:MAG: hypothetical protein U0Q15_03590 [Kineosporiaceae bacterium]
MTRTRRRGAALAVAVATALGALTAMPAVVAQAAPATITGTITDELTGAPVPGCVNATTWDDGEWAYADTCAGEDGRYTLDVVAGRAYQLEFSGGDYVDEYSGGVADPNEATIVKAPGTADASLQPRRPATGVLRYPDGKPVQGAEVAFVPAGGVNSWGSVTTGADGSWSASLLTGSYLVQYRMPDGELLWATGKPTRPAKPTLTQVLGKAPKPLTATVARPATLVVTAVDKDGVPLKGVCLTSTTTAGSPPCTGTTGTVTLTRQPGGRQSVVASVPDGSLGAVEKAVVLKRGKTTKVTLRLLPTATLTGTIVSEAGKPRAKVCVQVDAADVRVRPAYLDQQVASCSDSQGRFRVKGIPTGRYVVYVYGDETHPYVYAPGVARFPDAKVVTAKAATTVDSGTTVAGLGGTVTGVVTSPDGEPVAGAWVALGGDNPGRIGDGGAGIDTAKTDADGRYTITNVAQWSVPAMAYARDKPYAFTWTGGVTESAQAEKVQVSWGKTSTADIRFLPEAQLKVTMTGVPAGYAVEFDTISASGDPAGWGGGLRADDPTTVLRGFGTGDIRIKATMLRVDSTSSDDYVEWWYPSAAGPETATPVSVTAGEVGELTWAVPSK